MAYSTRTDCEAKGWSAVRDTESSAVVYCGHHIDSHGYSELWTVGFQGNRKTPDFESLLTSEESRQSRIDHYFQSVRKKEKAARGLQIGQVERKTNTAGEAYRSFTVSADGEIIAECTICPAEGQAEWDCGPELRERYQAQAEERGEDAEGILEGYSHGAQLKRAIKIEEACYQSRLAERPERAERAPSCQPDYMISDTLDVSDLYPLPCGHSVFLLEHTYRDPANWQNLKTRLSLRGEIEGGGSTVLTGFLTQLARCDGYQPGFHVCEATQQIEKFIDKLDSSPARFIEQHANGICPDCVYLENDRQAR